MKIREQWAKSSAHYRMVEIEHSITQECGDNSDYSIYDEIRDETWNRVPDAILNEIKDNWFEFGLIEVGYKKLRPKKKPKKTPKQRRLVRTRFRT